MKKALYRKWLRALRSGRYTKGKNCLVSYNGTNFCCLGVLADINGCEWGGEDDFLPYHANGRLQKKNDYLRGSINPGISIAAQGRLAGINDQSDSFEPVIEAIEKFVAAGSIKLTD